MVTGYFPGVKCGRGVLLTTHSFLVPRSWKVNLYLYPPSEPHRACKGNTLPLPLAQKHVHNLNNSEHLYITHSWLATLRSLFLMYSHGMHGTIILRNIQGTRWRSWLKHCATSRKVWFPLVSLEFFLNFIRAALCPWGRISLYEKWVPGIFLGG